MVLAVLVAKILDARRQEIFAEVITFGSNVMFDKRGGWVLLSAPLDILRRKRDVFWLHPDDVRFIWVRHFSFI